jgi:hypothetical protein
MPRYYLNFYTREKAVIDQDGHLFTGVDEAVLFTRELAQEMVCAGRSGVEWPSSRFEVADEEGRTVAVLPGSEILGNLVKRTLH